MGAPRIHALPGKSGAGNGQRLISTLNYVLCTVRRRRRRNNDKDTGVSVFYVCAYLRMFQGYRELLQVSGFRFRSKVGGYMYLGASSPPPFVSRWPFTSSPRAPLPSSPPQMATSLRSSLHGLALGPSKPKSKPTDPFSEQERIIVGIDFGYLFAPFPFSLHTQLTKIQQHDSQRRGVGTDLVTGGV